MEAIGWEKSNTANIGAVEIQALAEYFHFAFVIFSGVNAITMHMTYIRIGYAGNRN